jgi:hypothetical protein
VAVHFRRDFALAEGVAERRVEAGGDEHQLGVVLEGNVMIWIILIIFIFY